MNRVTFFALLLLGPALLNGLFGCDECNLSPYRYQIENYQAYPRRADAKRISELPITELPVGDTVTYRDLELILVGKERHVVHRSLGSGGSVCACDPAVIAVDSIRSLRVTSDQSYRMSLPAGSDLATVLSIGQSVYSQDPLSKFLGGSTKPAVSYYFLKFTESPEQTAQHRLTITVELSRGQRFTATTNPVVIKP